MLKWWNMSWYVFMSSLPVFFSCLQSCSVWVMWLCMFRELGTARAWLNATSAHPTANHHVCALSERGPTAPIISIHLVFALMFRRIWWCFISSAELSLNHVPFRALSVSVSLSLIAFERALLQLSCQTLSLDARWNHTQCIYFSLWESVAVQNILPLARLSRVSADAVSHFRVYCMSARCCPCLTTDRVQVLSELSWGSLVKVFLLLEARSISWLHSSPHKWEFCHHLLTL